MEAVGQFSASISSSGPLRSPAAATVLDRSGSSDARTLALPSSSLGEGHLFLRASKSSTAPSVVTCAAASKREKSSTRSRPASPSSPGTGFGAKAAAKPSFDAGVLLRRSEQLYTRLLAEYAAEGEVREFVICVREKRSATSKAAASVLDDWLPVAELALVSEQDASEAMPILLPIFCREVAECAAKGAVALRSISRSGLEYAYEPADAFYEHVMSGSNVKLSSEECPYGVLGLPKGAPASEVRASYRSLAAKNHPDRQFGADVSIAEVEFKRVTNAYDQIKRAGLASEGAPSYASLGGNARNGLSEPVVINSTNRVSDLPKGVKVAVRQLDSEIISQFLTRLYARSGGVTAV